MACGEGLHAAQYAAVGQRVSQRYGCVVAELRLLISGNTRRAECKLSIVRRAYSLPSYAPRLRTVSAPVPFSSLARADLLLERVYVGGTAGNAGDDPLAALLPVGNQGGFRYSGSPTQGTVRLVVLYTSGENEDWPDILDSATGTFRYYGDNRAPGHELHNTPRRGNQILRRAFALAVSGPSGRAAVPPFLLFERAGSAGRSVRFRGLMVPGSPLVPPDEQLVALWRNRGGERFQNYRATFTVLDADPVPRSWLDAVLAGDPMPGAPQAWSSWVSAGVVTALLAAPTTQHRTRAQQLPAKTEELALLNALWAHFQDRPIDFERCAVELFRLSAPGVENVDVTRPSRDGGRDATGQFAIGPAADPIRLNFALEAKCYRPGNSVGVRDIARLISRIKHREFGVLVTTSYVHEQAYREVRDDGHNVVIISGTDLVAILKTAALGTCAALQTWLDQSYPVQHD